jgi:hypothetical protein
MTALVRWGLMHCRDVRDTTTSRPAEQFVVQAKRSSQQFTVRDRQRLPTRGGHSNVPSSKAGLTIDIAP